MSPVLAAQATLAVALAAAVAPGPAWSQGAQVSTDAARALENRDYEGAMALIAVAVERGDPQARTLAGLLCVHALAGGCKAHDVSALLSPAAQAGEPDAQHALALALLRERPPRTDEALAWLRKAAEADHVVALLDLGQVEAASSDPSLVERGAARVWRAAELGFAPAQFALATLYETGRGVTSSLEQAARWYEAAAKQGHTVAQTRLGSLYEHGRGVASDPDVADHWYRMAAEAGHTEAQYSLGMMYMLGEVVQPDYFEGIYWLEQAAEVGHAKAQDALGRAYHQGIGVRQDREEALRWFRRAGKHGLPVAMHNAGVIYEHDFYLRNFALAAQWYERAAKAGYGHAMISLGDLYRLGYGVPESLSMAQAWYAQAAKSDDPAISERARNRLHTALSDALDVGIAAFGAGDRFPTPSQLFDAIIGAGIASKILYPNAGGPMDPDVQAAYDEVDRQNQAYQQQLLDVTMTGMQMDP